MNKNILIICALLFFGVSFGQKKQKIKGDKNVVESSTDIGFFNTVEIHDDLKINFTANNSSNSYWLKADSNLKEVIKFELIDSVLKVYTTHDIASKKKLEITLNATTFNTIKLFDKANLIQVGHMVVDTNFVVFAKDNTRLKIDVKAKNIEMNLSNNADGVIYFEADSLQLNLQDEIDVKGVLKAKYIDIRMAKDAEAKFEGYNESMNLTMVGASVLKASELMNKKIVLKLVNNSDAYLNCVEEINVFLDDKSTLYIYNTPKVNVKGLRGQSRIIKK